MQQGEEEEEEQEEEEEEEEDRFYSLLEGKAGEIKESEPAPDSSQPELVRDGRSSQRSDTSPLCGGD